MWKPKPLFTEVSSTHLPFRFGMHSPVFLAGSCFADEVGSLLKKYKFNVMANPFGVVFNPLSLCQLLGDALQNNAPAKELFVQRDEIWYHYQWHSELSHPSHEVLEEHIAQRLADAGRFIEHAKHEESYMVITLGTAWVYRLLNSGHLVNNCHKMPAALFNKELLSPETIAEALLGLKNKLPEKMHLLLTVSPVRHLKDTLPLNAVSKSVLRYAVHLAQQTCPTIAYFPAFEIMTDELRDYRFYKDDLIHPSAEAIAIIFRRFLELSTTQEALAFCQHWETLLRALSHRPFHKHTKAHRRFLEQTMRQLKDIGLVDVSTEINEVQTQLDALYNHG
jgi:hypothetical protein